MLGVIPLLLDFYISHSYIACNLDKLLGLFQNYVVVVLHLGFQ